MEKIEKSFGQLTTDLWKERRNHKKVSRILVTNTMISFVRRLLLAFIIIELTEYVWL